MMKPYWHYSLCICLALISGCVGVSREPRDGGPSQPVDVSHIPDATPQPVVRTRAGNAGTYKVLGRTYQVLADSHGYRERGTASWYGTKFHGRRTANGEVYDMYAMTAAHKTLPIPSYVRVTNVRDGRSVVVKINDRGPFHGNRLIDLSYAAARKLGIDATGTGLVEVQDVTPPKPGIVAASSASDNPIPGLYLQLGAFQGRDGAEKLQSQVASVVTDTVSVYAGSDRLHRVKIGPLPDDWHLVQLQDRLRSHGLEQGYPVRIE